MDNTVFISYSQHDRDVMERLRNDLELSGFKVWTDQKLELGTTWAREIERAIEESQAVILLLSPQAIASQWVQREMSFSVVDKKPIFPLLISDDVKESLPMYLADVHTLDARGDNYNDAVKKLTSEVSKFVREKESKSS